MSLITILELSTSWKEKLLEDYYKEKQCYISGWPTNEQILEYH